MTKDRCTGTAAGDGGAAAPNRALSAAVGAWLAGVEQATSAWLGTPSAFAARRHSSQGRAGHWRCYCSQACARGARVFSWSQRR